MGRVGVDSSQLVMSTAAGWRSSRLLRAAHHCTFLEQVELMIHVVALDFMGGPGCLAALPKRIHKDYLPVSIFQAEKYDEISIIS